MGEALGGDDVPRLCAFVTPAEQDDDGTAASLEVHAIAGTAMNAQLAYAVPNRLGVAGMAVCQSSQTKRNRCTGTLILELQAPLAECFGLLERDHATSVFYKLQRGKGISVRHDAGDAPWAPARATSRAQGKSLKSGLIR